MAAKKKVDGRTKEGRALKARNEKRRRAALRDDPVVKKTKATPRTKVKVVRKVGPKGRKRVRMVSPDPVTKAKLLAGRAEKLGKHAGKVAKLSAKLWGKAALVAQKALNKGDKLKLTENQRVKLTAIVGKGFIVDSLYTDAVEAAKEAAKEAATGTVADDKAFKRRFKKVANVAEAVINGEQTPEDEALKVVSDVLRGSFDA